MTGVARRWIAAGLGSGLLVLLLVIVSLGDLYRGEPPERLVRTELEIFEPPPPPPPPPIDQRGSRSAGPALLLARVDSPIVLEVMDLDVQLTSGELGGLGAGGWGGVEDIGAASLQLVGFSDLDETPMVLFAPTITYPQDAIDHRIDEFEVKIHIMIDEEGRTFPVRIVESPFPGLDDEFAEYASKVVFSPPKRLGIPVKTEYLWPVVFRRDTRRR